MPCMDPMGFYGRKNWEKTIKLQLVTKASFDYVSQRLQLEISFYPQMGPSLLLMIYPELFP